MPQLKNYVVDASRYNWQGSNLGIDLNFLSVNGGKVINCNSKPNFQI